MSLLAYLPIPPTVYGNFFSCSLIELGIFMNMLRKMREIETESGFAKRREGAPLCWKEAISRVSNAAPASSFSISDGSGRVGSTKAAQNTVSIHGSPPETRHGISCCLPRSLMRALQHNSFILPCKSSFIFGRVVCNQKSISLVIHV